MGQCKFCYNAHVWSKEPHDEEDYFNGGLHDDNDGSSCGIGHAMHYYRIHFNSGMGEACNIETSRWSKELGWVEVARYYPKFCPECGRCLEEYKIDERGTKYERL